MRAEKTLKLIIAIALFCMPAVITAQETEGQANTVSEQAEQGAVSEQNTVSEQKIEMEQPVETEKIETPETEKTEETPVPEQKKQAPAKKERENPGVALHLSYGGAMPVGDYGDTYEAGHLVSLTTMLYRWNFYGLCAGFNFRYNNLESKSGVANKSRFDIIQLAPALVWFYDIKLPNTKHAYFNNRPLTFYVRAADGLSILMYQSDLYPSITEYIHAFELSVGLTYPIYKILELGLDMGYRVISTAGSPMHTMMISFIIGVRI